MTRPRLGGHCKVQEIGARVSSSESYSREIPAETCRKVACRKEVDSHPIQTSIGNSGYVTFLMFSDFVARSAASFTFRSRILLSIQIHRFVVEHGTSINRRISAWHGWY